MSKYIPGSGAIQPKLVVLVDSPSYKDSQSGQLLTDSSEIDKVLSECNIPKSELWFTSVSKYYVENNKKGSGRKIPFHVRAKRSSLDLDQMLHELRVELNSLKPNCILALGSGALWALTNRNEIQDYRGSILYSSTMGKKLVPAYNPQQLNWNAEDVEFKGYWNRALMVHDFGRAYKQSQTSEYAIPNRRLVICKSYIQLYEFFQQHSHLDLLGVDIEAGGTYLPVCIGFSFSPHYGMCVPLWNHDNISSIPPREMVKIWQLIAETLIQKGIVGQNFNYDRDKIKRLGFIIRRLVDDIMLKGFAINPELPKSQAFNQSVYTEEPFYKNEGMYHGSLEDLFYGCARDACVMMEINQKMNSDLIELGQMRFYRNFLMTLPEMYLEIENNGFGIDTAIRDKLLRKYIKWDEELRYELYTLIGTSINTNSPKQVATLLFETLKCPRRPGTGEEELTSLLNLQSFTDSTKRRVVEIILEDRRVRKSISTYLMALPDYDGRMKTTCFPCLETGRSSTGQQDPPIRPSIEGLRNAEGKKMQPKSMGIAFQTMTKHGDIGSDIRSMYVPFNNMIPSEDNQ